MNENIVLPLVTVIIPTYNSEKYVIKTLESVRNQHYLNWEAVIVDDGSEDLTVQIIEEYIQNDSRFHFYRRNVEKKGGNVCRNLGIEYAKGTFLLFLDADDLLAPYCLEQRVKKISNTSLDLGVFNMYSFLGDKKKAKLYSNLNVDNVLFHYFALDWVWQTSAPLWRKDFIVKIGGFNVNYSRLQDPELHLRAFLNVPNYKLFPDSIPDAYYRQDFYLDKDIIRKKQINCYWSIKQFLHDYIFSLQEYKTLNPYIYHKTMNALMTKSMIHYWNTNVEDYDAFVKYFKDVRENCDFFLKLLSSDFFSRIFKLIIRVELGREVILWLLSKINIYYNNKISDKPL
ncbi:MULTISPECIES: glycosyltransferase family 2 protein [Bacteroides]|uniref:glycosyltransferase family 2 protein n=1 Tax=Bacteroides TaxID=816 RepID=UPI001CCC64CD|nr:MULTISPECIES: glycosyltransferase family 2 protein [Bacteroides]UBD71981.1 glycosyltransferase [Bacteroides cellulosilyticus]